MRHRKKTKAGNFFTKRKWDLFFVILGLCAAVYYAFHQYFLAHSRLLPSVGGIYTETTVGMFQNLSPFVESTSLLERDLRRLIFMGLLQYDTVSGKMEGGLADFRISEDGRQYFLTLKDTARFQDGSKVTTDDVIFTIEKLIQNPNFPNHRLRDAFEYVSLEVVDEQEVKFNIPERNVFFLNLLTVPIVPEKYFKNILIEEIIDPDFPFNKHPVGAGPFGFKQVVLNDDGSFRVFLEPNQFYFAGVPKLEQIVFYVYPNFEHLKVAKGWTTSFSNIPFRDSSDFESDLYGEYERREYVLPRFVGIFFNLDQLMIGREVALRKALELSMDKIGILEKEIGWNRVHSSLFFEGVAGWHETDFVKARKLLRDNGIPFNEALSMRTYGELEEPVVLHMITSTDPPVYSRFAQRIIRVWERELDIQVQLDILDPDEFNQALVDRNYDIVLFGQDFSENFDSLSLWHSSQTGELNLSNLTRDDVDYLIDEIRFSGAQSDMVVLNDKIMEVVPAVIFATPKYDVLVSKYLHGFSETFGTIRSHSDRFSGVSKWYMVERLNWNLPEGASKLKGFVRWMME